MNQNKITSDTKLSDRDFINLGIFTIENDYQQRYAGFNPNSAESYIIFSPGISERFPVFAHLHFRSGQALAVHFAVGG